MPIEEGAAGLEPLKPTKLIAGADAAPYNGADETALLMETGGPELPITNGEAMFEPVSIPSPDEPKVGVDAV